MNVKFARTEKCASADSETREEGRREEKRMPSKEESARGPDGKRKEKKEKKKDGIRVVSEHKEHKHFRNQQRVGGGKKENESHRSLVLLLQVRRSSPVPFIVSHHPKARLHGQMGH